MIPADAHVDNIGHSLNILQGTRFNSVQYVATLYYVVSNVMYLKPNGTFPGLAVSQVRDPTYFDLLRWRER